MNSKKIVSCALVTLMCFAFAISAFAESRSGASASYSAGKVKHYFVTSNSISKRDSEIWIQVTDNVSYSEFRNEKTGELSSETGRHTTYLASPNGAKLSTVSKTIYGTDSDVFLLNELQDAKQASTIHLRIYSPKYSTYENNTDSAKKWYLKTAGSFSGVSRPTSSANNVSIDLEAGQD